jgi:hypothetical protein
MNRQGHYYLSATTAATYVGATAPTGSLDAITIAAPGGALLVAAAIIADRLPDRDQKWPLQGLPFIVHRGLTHRAWFHAIIALAVYIIAASAGIVYAPSLALGTMIGLAAHAVGDMMTPDGLAYFSFRILEDKRPQRERPRRDREIHILPFRIRSVELGPPRKNKYGEIVRTRQRWHRTYRVTVPLKGGRSFTYVAASQEHVLAAVTVLYLAVLYLTRGAAL